MSIETKGKSKKTRGHVPQAYLGSDYISATGTTDEGPIGNGMARIKAAKRSRSGRKTDGNSNYLLGGMMSKTVQMLRSESAKRKGLN